MLFTEFPLDDRLQRALATAEFVSPTPIQEAALPVAMAGRDVVGTAQTGTGKTAAFVLPILQRIIATPLAMRKTRAVILAPTRELVEQILAVIRDWPSILIFAPSRCTAEWPCSSRRARCAAAWISSSPAPVACSITSIAAIPIFVKWTAWCWMKRIACWTWDSCRPFRRLSRHCPSNGKPCFSPPPSPKN